jgi:formate--tetrahydrofolate ligase
MKLHTGKYHVVPGHGLPAGLLTENPDDVIAGASNLRRQIQAVRLHGLSPVVCVNRFPTDHESELRAVGEVCQDAGVAWAASDHWARGGEGALELARLVVSACEDTSGANGVSDPAAAAPNGRSVPALTEARNRLDGFRYLYDLETPLAEKIETIAVSVYGASGVAFERKAEQQLREYEARGYGRLPVCMAKTHLSLTDNSARKGAPEGFTLPIRELRASLGAGFVVPLVGSVRTMPGLSSRPNAMGIDIEDGEIVGLA